MVSDTKSESDYRYDNFRLSHLLADMRFNPNTPAAGDRLPQLDLHTLDGERITLGDLDRPHLFVFGSNTCPMTASASEIIEDLHLAFGEKISFVLVQVREAHPGEDIPQPSSFEEKEALAGKLRDTLGVRFTVAVDDLDGSFHSSLDPKPNAAYLVDTQGTILFRSMWSSDHDGLRSALAVTSEGRTPDKFQSTRRMKPLLRALGHVDPVIRSAGPRASLDLLRSAPPMLLGARLAGLFRQVSPSRRGHALLITSGVIFVAVATIIALLL